VWRESLSQGGKPSKEQGDRPKRSLRVILERSNPHEPKTRMLCSTGMRRELTSLAYFPASGWLEAPFVRLPSLLGPFPTRGTRSRRGG